MITAVAVVPGALALLPRYAGVIDVLADLRAACLEAVEDVATDADRVVLVSATDRAPRHTGVSIGRRVGEVLLDGRTQESVEIPWDATVQECLTAGRGLLEAYAERGTTALVVVADGSACRSAKAPGHLDERSLPFDESWVTALRGTDARALAELDPGLATELLAHGRAPLQVLAGVLGESGDDGGRWLCASLEASDPFGVQYVVARLTRG